MLKQLRSHHREIARLSVQGFTPNEIAMQLNRNPQTVYKILRDPLCKSFLNGLLDKADTQVINVRKALVDLNRPAVENIKDILDTEKDVPAPANVRLAAAKDVLDRNGYKAPDKVMHAHGHFTLDDLKKLRERADAVDVDCLAETV